MCERRLHLPQYLPAPSNVFQRRPFIFIHFHMCDEENPVFSYILKCASGVRAHAQFPGTHTHVQAHMHAYACRCAPRITAARTRTHRKVALSFSGGVRGCAGASTVGWVTLVPRVPFSYNHSLLVQRERSCVSNPCWCAERAVGYGRSCVSNPCWFRKSDPVRQKLRLKPSCVVPYGGGSGSVCKGSYSPSAGAARRTTAP
jgi:hypothetical protein